MDTKHYSTNELRELIHAAQGPECGMPQCSFPWNDLAHILDASAGGKRTPSNLIGLCRTCHANYDQNKRWSHRELMRFRKWWLLNTGETHDSDV